MRAQTSSPFFLHPVLFTPSFSIGAVLASVFGWLILPLASCPERPQGAPQGCDVATQNNGWRYLLGTVACIVQKGSSCRFRRISHARSLAQSELASFFF
jgi:hypothetical protein